MGRPLPYQPDIGDEICERLAGGESLLSISRDERMPAQSTIYQWLLRTPAFAEKYARAREFWAESEFEKMMEIADTPQLGEKTKISEGKTEITTGDMVDHRRLQVDTRKWALARMSPRKYSERLLNEHSGPEGKPLEIRVTGIIAPEAEE